VQQQLQAALVQQDHQGQGHNQVKLDHQPQLQYLQQLLYTQAGQL
jgi:hypothetical protein